MNETTATYERFAEDYRECHQDRSVVAEQRERFLDALDGDRVLDVGCGPGWETASFCEAGLTVTGIDLSPSFLEMASDEVPGASFARMDMRRLGFADSSFDGLWACASFHHVPRDRAAPTLAEFHRVLGPGGVVQLTCKRGEGGTTETTGDTFGDEDRRRLVRYAPDELRDLAVREGFRVERLATSDDWIDLLLRA